VKSVSGKDFARLLGKNGWTLRRTGGSHHVYAKPGYNARISIPVHGNRALKTGLLRHFMKVAHGGHSRRQGPLHALPAGRYLGGELQGGRGGGQRLRALPRRHLSPGRAQALRDRGDDPAQPLPRAAPGAGGGPAPRASLRMAFDRKTTPGYTESGALGSR